MSDILKLLIVDDDEVDRMTLLRALKKAQLEVQVTTCDQGAEALRALSAEQFALVFIDFLLPDTDGVSLLREIREKGHETPVIMITSQGDEQIAAEALRNGAADYLSKNLFTPEGIARSVRHALTVYAAEQERRAAEAALISSRERLKEAQKLARIGSWEYNVKTQEVFWSEEMFQILELPVSTTPTLEDLISRIHPDDVNIREQLLQDAIRQKKKYQVDFRLRLPGNKTKFVSANGRPVLDAAGEVVAIAGTTQDISDRISTRNALKESEKRYLMLLETMNEGVLHVDKDHVILYANKSFCEMMGYEKKEVIGKNLSMFVPDEATRHFLENKNTLRLQLISDQYEVELQRKDKSRICFLVGASPLMNDNGEVTGSLGTFTDISQRKKIEEALKSSEKLFRTLFEDAQGLIWTHSLDGNILSMNKAGAQMAGYDPDELVGRPFTEILAQDTLPDYELYLKNIAEQKQATGIFKIFNRQSHRYHYLFFRNILYTEPGKSPYVIASAQDITDRIQAEEALREAKLIAEKSVKVKEQFLANISHEIRTPMNGIIGLAGVLEKMIQNEEQRSYLQAIQSSADKLLVIINDILDFSKIQSGKIEFEETIFDPKQVLKECVRLFEPRAVEQQNKLKAIIDADVPDQVIGDPGKLSQILNNLLSNSVKFTQNGQIKVFLEVNQDSSDQVELEFTVRDTGIGIPAEKINTVFESFTQASSDTTRKYGGTGLGLTISKQFVELQGGSIQVQSKANEGSTFTFRLNFRKTDVPAAAPMVQALVPANPESLGKIRVLLAEDNQINQLLVKKVMQDWNFELDIAENGIAALEKFQEADYQLILMDMQMPEMDGYEATDYIRKTKGPKGATPIIALTAHASQGEAEKCLRAGANAYVSKPFKPEQLLHEIMKLAGANLETPLLPQAETSGAALPATPLINLAYLREMADGDVEFMEEIMQMFIQQTPENLNLLVDLAVDQNWKEIKSLAHKMKSSVVLIGNQELEEIFVNLQVYALSANPEELIPPLIYRAQFICEGAISELKKEVKLLKRADQS